MSEPRAREDEAAAGNSVPKNDDIQRILASQPRGPPRRTPTLLDGTQLSLSFL